MTASQLAAALAAFAPTLASALGHQAPTIRPGR